MRKFIITSTKFKGQAEAVYDQGGLISTISMLATNMDAETRYKFKAAIPVTTRHIEAGGHSLVSCTIIEADFDLTFETFWQAYDHKINRKRCEPLWAKLSKARQVAAWQGVEAYDKYLAATGYRKKADPENYLRKEMWENEWS